ncbi:MAG: Mu transposase C-terminal domain-containing protein [Candidatus Cloacimonetes bacterium]|nr:Mu transposase C-terminal domain-containing protein [Candidatus Cloacimonadota bacterium]
MLRYSGDLEHPYSLLENLRYCGRKSRLDPLLRNRIRELAVDERNLQPSWIYTFLNDQLLMFDECLPISERTVQIMVRDFRRDIYTKSLGKGKKEMKNKVKLHVVRINDLMPGEIFESDAHVCNLLLKSPFYCHRNPSKRYLVRPVLIVWLDVATGTIVGHRVCLSENKNAVKNSLIDAIARFGIPQKIRLDNSGSYKNVAYAPLAFYKEAIGKRRLTTDEKIAKRMLESGDKGLYGNLGIDYHFTIPGNPESKSIEAFWNYCVAPFEKSFSSWIGNKPENRPAIFNGMDNKTLVRKYGEKFSTWNEFCERLDRYIDYYNNKVRASLVTIDGEQLTPIQAYNQLEYTVPNQTELLSKMRDPYIEMRTVQRSVLEKNGILYWHPSFASMIGKKVGIYYDEKNLNELTIVNERGQIHLEKAIAINPGLQSGNDFTALIENNRRVKIGKLFYLSLTDVSGAMKVEKMLKTVSKELLPLSNSKETDEVKYLNFDDALDAIAGECEETEDIPALENQDIETDDTEMTDEEKELRESLKNRLRMDVLMKNNYKSIINYKEGNQ